MFGESVSSTPSFLAVVYSWFTPTVFFVLLQLMIGTIFITSTFSKQKHQNHQDSHGDQHPQQLARSPSVLQRLKSINFYPYRSQESRHHTPEFQATHEPPLPRSPSMLQRLKSINLYNYFPTDTISSKFATPDTNLLKATHESDTHFDLTNTHEPEKHHLDDAQVEESDEEEMDDVWEIQHPESERSLDEIYSQLQGGHVTRSKSDTKPASGEVPEKLARKMKKSATTKSAFSHFWEKDIVENRRPATMKEAKVSESEADDEVDARADDFINKFKQQLKLQRLDSIMRYKEVIQRSGQDELGATG